MSDVISPPSRAVALLSAAAVTAVLAGCGVLGGRQVDRTPVPAAWTAQIAATAPTGHSGFATVSIMTTGQTRANVTLSGGAAGGDHPWFIHEGDCSDPGSIMGDEGSYPRLRPNERGNASATATLDVRLDPEEEYAIVVHGGPENLETVVGCGPLVRSG
ncbi:MAG: hypothetical protein R3199_03110 [Gemmatimonadota bacterium]|nr:hypothetical protein [Gemmatimonadota bacterium]